METDVSLISHLMTLIEEAEDHLLGPVVNIALSVYVVLSIIEPGRAARLFLRLRQVRLHISLVATSAQIPIENLVLWQAADLPPINRLSLSNLRLAVDDATIQTEMLCAEYAKKHNVLWSFIDELSRNDHPADLTRSLMLAGFDDIDDRALPLFSDMKLKHGFLKNVMTKAREAYERNAWARDGFDKTQSASDNVEYWRFSQLMLKAADTRHVLWFRSSETSVS